MSKPNKSFKYKALANDIWAKRQELGKGQALDIRATAEKAGINYLTLYRMEQGQENPKIENLIAVCNWLGKPIQTYFS